MATSDGTVAVKVGYSFALVPGSELWGIALKDTGSRVTVNGQEYGLMTGATYEDSRMLDGVLDGHGEMPINEHLASPWDEGEVLTVVVEYDEPDGFGGGYEVGRAPEGSPELAELVEKAVRDVDDYVASGMEWASAFKGIGDFEDVNAGTAELLHTASKDDRCYDLDSESRDMEAASDELGRTGKNGIDGRDDR